MTAIPPSDTTLGDLRLTEVFLRFDGPRLFACENRSGQAFVGVFVDESDSGQTFLYLPVSSERLIAIRSGNLSLRQAFQEPEDGFLYRVEYQSDGSAEAFHLPSDQTPEEWLPEPDAYLHLPTQTQEAFSADELRIEAERSGRPLAALRLHTAESRTEYPLRSLGIIMGLVQDSVDAFAQEVAGKATTAGPIQQEITSATELAFTDVRAASFVIVVAPHQTGQLFSSPLVSEALQRIQRLLAAGADLEGLRAEVGALKKRALSKYRDLLEEIDDSSTGVEMYLADARGNIESASLTRDQISQTLDVIRWIDTEPARLLTVEGILVGVNVRTRVFEMFDEVAAKKYSGKAVDRARNQMPGLTVSRRYRAELLQETEYLGLTGEQTYKYKLMNIEAID